MTEIFRGNMSHLLSLMRDGLWELTNHGQSPIEDGQTFCPCCRKVYKPDFPSIDDCQTLDQREQHLSGICSSTCWDSLFPEDEDDRE